jgi:hypothetical protein
VFFFDSEQKRETILKRTIGSFVKDVIKKKEDEENEKKKQAEE